MLKTFIDCQKRHYSTTYRKRIRIRCRDGQLSVFTSYMSYTSYTTYTTYTMYTTHKQYTEEVTMIEFKEYDNLIEKVKKSGNEHVFNFWNDLSHDEKLSLLKELEEINFDHLKNVHSSEFTSDFGEFKPAPFISISKCDEAAVCDIKKLGEDYIKSGKIAAFLVAGGQGTRLGHSGPKGKYPAGRISGKSLFQIFAEKIKKYSLKYETTIPWLIMTSKENHEETFSFFEENNYFGLDKENVTLFSQNEIPSLSLEGKLILSHKNKIFKNPDGHGGSLTALRTNGILEKIKAIGIETISYFQVDNPLVKIVDPLFIGYHLKHKSLVSSKAILKAYPEERVGVFVEYNEGRKGIVEYSDLTPEQLNAVDEKGELLYCGGNIAVHLFDINFLEDITGSDNALQYHKALKKIKTLNSDGSIKEIDGNKFEKFIFDALPLAQHSLIVETIREEEFGPIKNKEGVDSPQTSGDLMTNLYKSWLNKRGIVVPANVKNLEISPLIAVEAEDLSDGLTVSNEESVYVG